MNGKKQKEIEKFAKSFRWTPKNYYWKHTLRVRKYALMIQKQIGGDKDVVETAALLHDIGKAQLLAPGHEALSAQLAKEFLTKLNMNNKKIEKILECIKYENFESLEAKILRSADSMSLIMDNSGGREWFFENILGNNDKNIVSEIKKSYREIGFDFAKNIVRERYRSLLATYNLKQD